MDNMLNTKARDVTKELVRCRQEVETLNTQVLVGESEVKELKVKLAEMEKGVEDFEYMIAAKEGIKKLRDNLHKQTMEIARLRFEEAKAVEKSSQIPILEARCEAFKREKEGLQEQVKKLEEKYGEVVTKVLPHTCKQLMNSEEVGVLLANCINSARIWERAMVLEELAASGKTVVLSEREDYNAQGPHLFDTASKALANAQFPYVQEISARPNATIKELLTMKPKEITKV